MIHNDSVLRNCKFNAGNLSSDGGAVLLYKFLQKAGYFDLLKIIPFCENRSGHKYSNTKITLQMLISFLLGYFTQSEARHLRNDPLINDDKFIASQPTLSKMFKRITRLTTNALSEMNKKISCDYVNKNLIDIILDIDSTLIELYGQQEALAYIHHYSANGYHPLIINEGHTGLALFALLRTGSAYSGNGAKEAFQEVLGSLNREGKKIHMRGDSAFYDSKLMKYLDENDVEFFIRAKNFKKLTEAVYAFVQKTSMDHIHDYSSNNPLYGEIRYTPNAIFNNKDYRLVFKCYPVNTDDQDNQLIDEPELGIYCVITNCTSKTPKEVMDFYEARGAIENCNKEIKNDFGAGTLSHRYFLENEFEFLLKAYAYNLYQIFRMEILEDRDYKMMMSTYRNRYQKIAVKIITHGRKKQLNYSSAYPYQERFCHYLEKTLDYDYGQIGYSCG